LFLIGLRGSGKTTAGRLVAAGLGWPFHDADAVLEAAAGRSIHDIFAADGEAHFRDLEERTLVELIAGGPAVIATGGGVVLREDNRRRMKTAGRVVWLTADADTLWQRILADPATADRRPNLSGGGREEVAELLRAREPLYRAVADLVVPVAGRSPEQIAGDILTACSTSSWTTVQ
jgi:shikimate kinase